MPAANLLSCSLRQRSQANVRIPVTSMATSGFASTSYAPRFRASAQRYSSAKREATITEGGAANSFQISGIESELQTTTGIRWLRRSWTAAATLCAGCTLQLSRHRSRARARWSSWVGLTDSTVIVSALPGAGWDGPWTGERCVIGLLTFLCSNDGCRFAFSCTTQFAWFCRQNVNGPATSDALFY